MSEEDAGVEAARFAGTTRLYGEAARERLRSSHAMVVGVGGVGSWAAEALARTGVGTLTLVDLDEVCVSNCNRQVCALSSTVGQLKTRVLADRIRDISPTCACFGVEDFVDGSNVMELFQGGPRRVDVVLDCIDSARDKVSMLRACDSLGLPIVVCGAAGGRGDATAIRTKVGDLDVCGDALLRTTRKRWRQARRKAGLEAPAPLRPDKRPRPGARGSRARPANEARVTAVYSEEVQRSRPDAKTGSCDMGLGSSVLVTAPMGFAAAAAAVDVLLRNEAAEAAEAALATDGDDWEEADCPCSDFGAAGAAGGGRRGAASRRRGPPPRGGSGGPPSWRRSGLSGRGRGLGRGLGRRAALVQAMEDDGAGTPIRVLRQSCALGPVDTHCHAHLGASDAGACAAALVVCSTGPGDWDRVTAAKASARAVAFGVHPWWAGDLDEDWAVRLEDRLVRWPDALVGECGLDARAGGGAPAGRGAPVDLDAQDRIFRRQLALAAEYDRPTTVHCVKAVDAVRRAIDAEQPPAVAFHAFGGSLESADVLRKAVDAYGGRAYFGFAAAHTSKHTQRLLEGLPDSAILLESDGEDAATIDDDLRIMRSAIANARGWTHVEAHAALEMNAASFLATPPR